MLSRILPLAKHDHYHIERVKFGVPLDQVCAVNRDIPGPLLVLILKLNKEAPLKKDVFRAPGHQANMKKLVHFLQSGRLVNIDKFSVYTIASVLKKFLRKIPGGIFGHEMEQRLFEVINFDNIDDKRDEMHRLITSLPVVNQQLLVLLFGTFRAIASAAELAGTGMTSEALGVSVAPSFFQSVSDGYKIAKMEDVQRFKTHITVATTIIKFLIDNFGICNLFGRENYEYYARISGRVLKVEDNYIFAFKYPPDTLLSGGDRQSPLLCAAYSSVGAGGCIYIKSGFVVPAAFMGGAAAALGDDAYARLSMSLEENVFKVIIYRLRFQLVTVFVSSFCLVRRTARRPTKARRRAARRARRRRRRPATWCSCITRPSWTSATSSTSCTRQNQPNHCHSCRPCTNGRCNA